MLGASLASAEEDIVNDNHLLEFANKDLINMNEALLSLQQGNPIILPLE